MFGMDLVKKLRTCYEMGMSHNNKWFYHTTGGKTVIFDTEKWGKVAELTKPNHPSHVRFSMDDDLLYVKSTVGTFCVYQTNDFQLINTIKSGRSFQIQEGAFAVLEPLTVLDILKINDEKQVCTLNIEAGTYLVLTKLKGTHIGFEQFIQGERFYLYTLSDIYGEKGWLAQSLVRVKNPITKPSYSVQSMEFNEWDLIYFCSARHTYIFVLRDYQLVFMDEELKTILRRESLLDKGMSNLDEYFVHIDVSADGYHILLTSNQRVLILNFGDLKPIFIEELRYACFAEFSETNDYLFVGTWSNGYVLRNTLR